MRRIPFDVWVAGTVAIGVLLIAGNTFMPLFVSLYVALCAYVVVKSFTE